MMGQHGQESTFKGFAADRRRTVLFLCFFHVLINLGDKLFQDETYIATFNEKSLSDMNLDLFTMHR